MVREGIVIGHKISCKCIEVDKERKIEAIERLPPPQDIKGIGSFLCHAGFYRRFIKNFSKISKPLANLLQNNVRFNFAESYLVAFNTLKKALLDAPIIKPPIWDNPFELLWEASNEVVGAILLQRNGANFNIIHHASHTLNEAQRNYPMVEKKLVDVISSHDKFRSYVYDALVKVHMDRDGLKEILEKKLMLNLE
jgi:hypothetical protein